MVALKQSLGKFFFDLPTPYTPIVETSMYKGIETSVRYF